MTPKTEILHESSRGNYFVTGETYTGYVGGHPFCIDQKLFRYVDSHILTKEVIMAAEKKAHMNLCGAQGCPMSFEEHEEITALKVFCKKPMFLKPKSYWPNPDKKAPKELHQFLLKLKDMKKWDNFCFFDKDGEKKAKEFPDA